MGSGRFDPSDWARYTTLNSYSTRSTASIFSKTEIDKDLDPKNIKVRESRDSALNPNSTPIIIGIDETGSMGHLADLMIRKGFPILINGIYDRKPVTDPHILCMGIGDAECDNSPMQATQFEAEAVPLISQVEKIYLEGNGGGNSYEGYSLAWLFAATKTSTDSFEKRNKKGYLFTVGDEYPTAKLVAEDIKRIFGESLFQGKELSTDDLLTMVTRQWEVFHIVVAQGSFCKSTGVDKVKSAWQKYLGQRVIVLDDAEKMAEVIVSAIQVAEGADRDSVASSWDGSTSLVVKNAIQSLDKNNSSKDSGVVTL